MSTKAHEALFPALACYRYSKVNPVFSSFIHPLSSNMCLIKTTSHILSPHVPAQLFVLAMPSLFKLDQWGRSLNNSLMRFDAWFVYVTPQGDEVCYWWSSCQRSSCKPALSCAREKSPCSSSNSFSFTVYILGLEWNHQKQSGNLRQDSSSGELVAEVLVLSSPSSKSQLLQSYVIEIFIVGEVHLAEVE